MASYYSCCLNLGVTFAAHMLQGADVVVNADNPIIFNIILLNVGSNYDESTGIFTAPYSGKDKSRGVVIGGSSCSLQPLLRQFLLLFMKYDPEISSIW